ncbi:MAG: FAD-dependent oxidoreductase [Syntrophobacterales bacterium]
MSDLLIIGLGPAGVAAAVYAGRNKVKTLVISEDIVGQSVVSANIQNWIGILSFSGAEMAARLSEHLDTFKEDVKVFMASVIKSITKLDNKTKTIFKVRPRIMSMRHKTLDR